MTYDKQTELERDKSQAGRQLHGISAIRLSRRVNNTSDNTLIMPDNQPREISMLIIDSLRSTTSTSARTSGLRLPANR
jgi:hypothetical protein